MKNIVLLFLLVIAPILTAADGASSSSTTTTSIPAVPFVVQWGMCRILGGRERQEDTCSAFTGFNGDSHKAFMGVYDGHGGCDVSNHVAGVLPKMVGAQLASAISPEQMLINAFQKANQSLNFDVAEQQGSTAVTALIDSVSQTAHIAWAGDARACLLEHGKIILQTKDHNPSDPDELARIRRDFPNAQIEGTEGKCARLGGDINLSRAFGDTIHGGNGLICTPETIEWTLGQSRTLLLCSDGFVDVSNATCSTVEQEFAEVQDLLANPVLVDERLEYFTDYTAEGNCNRLILLAKMLCNSSHRNQIMAKALQRSGSVTEPFPFDNVTILLVQLARESNPDQIEHSPVTTETIVLTDRVIKGAY